MRAVCLWLALAFLPAGAADSVHVEHRARREALAKALPDGAIALFGSIEPETGELRTGFLQEPNFQYLTGWNEPGAMLLIEPGDAGIAREILFLPRRNEKNERYTGRKVDPMDDNAAKVAGFERVLPVERFEAELRSSLERRASIFTSGKNAEQRLAALEPLRKVGSADPAIARLRMKKSEREIEALQRSVDATVAAQRAAWKRAAPGLFEYQLAAIIAGTWGERGCERNAFAPIVASGPSGVVLHYFRNSRRIDKGELVLIDVGAECGGYAADLTRTIPVGAKFSARQRELYEIVLGAQKAAIAAVKPGALIGMKQPGSLYRIAVDYLDAHGKLGKYLPHGVSHHVGLEVHDAADNDAPLEEGMVITVEPGLYIPEEGIGIRIEDMVLVTRNGARILSAALPREVAEIEKAIGQ
jgi:Xaa-Pro aminopeptidase